MPRKMVGPGDAISAQYDASKELGESATVWAERPDYVVAPADLGIVRKGQRLEVRAVVDAGFSCPGNCGGKCRRIWHVEHELSGARFTIFECVACGFQWAEGWH